MRVRPETDADRAAIRAVNEAAFESSAEADIVDSLRAHQGGEVVSLVAERDGDVAGHILFSRVAIVGHEGLKLMSLGPLAVLPGHQRNGVGSELVRDGLIRCRESGAQAVVVVGHPQFYPRFGFVPAHRYAILCEFDVPDDVFMLVELTPQALSGVSGVVVNDAAFGGAGQ